ncbi:hypothetical protein OHA98_36635 [Streptomyces sp. NBC_00654]|uniref:hypothetical protein n=1 Tax=Streptomyces sp. NBC_00654 TaxID=2975799 RepID=UPI00225C2EDB|nr:hypothetical protein [Streptomyces sp. NBC_00654]MCX4970190.1 hypothetical protein [Streptomyces sp. NBC_00654]
MTTPGHGSPSRDSAQSTGPQSIAATHIDSLTQNIISMGASPVAGWLLLVPVCFVVVYAVLGWPSGGFEGQAGWFTLFLLFLTAAALGAVRHLTRPGGTERRRNGAGNGRRKGNADGLRNGDGQRNRAGNGPGKRPGRRLLWVPLASLLFSLLSWVSFEALAGNSQVPVNIEIVGTQPLDGVQRRTLTLIVAAPAAEDRRDRLRLALTISEENPAKPACVHRATATITARTASVTPRMESVPARSERDFTLGTRGTPVEFTLDVTSDSRCPMRLEKALGTLHNG